MIRWGLVGCGNVAETKGGPALRQAEGSSLVAVASRDRSRAEDFARRHGAERSYTALEDLLADDQIDGVYIATPPHVHAEQAVACAAAGKHILCEKPMAMTVPECDRIIASAAEAGVQLMVAYYRRCYPAVAKVKQLLDSGRIGTPTRIRTEAASLLDANLDPTAFWRIDPAIGGGGFLWDVGSHRIDLMVHLLGDVMQVSAFVDTTTFDIAVDDSAVLVLRFACGAQGIGAYHWNVSRRSDDLDIGGTAGGVSCNLWSGRVDLFTEEGHETWNCPPPSSTHLHLVEDFVAAIAAGRPNCCNGGEGRKTNAIIEAAVTSSREGRTVRIGASA